MENNWGIGTTNWGKFSSRTPGAAPVWSPHFHFFLLLFFLKMDLVWWWSSQGRCHAVTQAGVYFTSGTHCQRLETLIVLFRCPKDLHKKSFNLTFFFFFPNIYMTYYLQQWLQPNWEPTKRSMKMLPWSSGQQNHVRNTAFVSNAHQWQSSTGFKRIGLHIFKLWVCLFTC